MKNLLKTACILLITFDSLFAQEDKLVLFGKIKNSKNDTIVLSNHYGKFVTATNSNGEFRFDENVKNPDFLNFKIADKQATLYLFKGDALEMNFDLMNFNETVRFTGDQAELNQKLFLVSSGKAAPDFSFRDTKNNLVQLSDFKGKYIYIDIWNSGCKPCFKEFKKMNAIVEKYQDDEIVFIGISLDKKEDVWEKTIKKHELHGIQLFGEGWKSDFVKDFFIFFNPRFILIDKEQNIKYLSAPRPSGNIDKILENLF